MQDNKSYKITEAQFRKNWSGAHGEMADYAVKLEGVDEWVQLTQKPETPAPTVGAELFGHTWVQTSNGKSYLRFKKENPQFQGGSRSPSSGLGEVLDMTYITKLLEAIATEVGGDAAAAIKRTDNVPQDVDDRPIDLSEIPF